jgi:MoxR-like ATPase
MATQVQTIERSALAEVARLGREVIAEVGNSFLGSPEPIELLLTALVARGHVLLEGVPGVAKTTLCKSFAAVLGCTFRRIQFTPDLLPSDITGTYVLDGRTTQFVLREGPIFAHVILGDEINRAPAKTQSALLEAMQEAAVTIDGRRHDLPRPFTVFATMNPIEHEGTYPLPEAQLDRFLFKLLVGYPEPEVEARLLSEAHARSPSATPLELGVHAVSSPAELAAARELVERIEVRADLPGYVVALLGATRAARSLVLGASPRAGVMCLRAAKARAALEGLEYVTPDHIKEVFLPALRHRVVLDPAEELEGVRADAVLERILDSVEVPR